MKTRKRSPNNTRVKIKLKVGEATAISRIAECVARKLIAGHGSRLAFAITRLIHEKVFANYKRMQREHPDEEVQ